MVERCQLCGARQQADAEVCHECGAPRQPSTDGPALDTAVEAIPSIRDDRAATAPEFMFGEGASSITFEPAGKSRAARWAVLALILGGGVAAAVFYVRGGASADPNATESDDGAASVVTAPEPSPAWSAGPQDCAALSAMAGSWNVTTNVTGARSAKKLGIAGHYRLDVALQGGDDGCTAQATLAKTGFTGSVFQERHIQRATAELQRGQGAFAFGFGARFPLRDLRTKGVDQQFVFAIRDDRLVGVWRQRGTEWEASGLQGILVGDRQTPSDALVPRIDALPCAARCALTCDALAQPQGAEVPGLSGCTTACEDAGDAAVPVCESRQPTADDLRLAVTGPAPTLGALCPDTQCELDPKLARGRVLRVEGGEGPLHEAHLVHSTGRGEGKRGRLRLALRSDAGWFLSDAVAPLAGTEGTQDVQSARMSVTALGSGQAPTTVVGHFTLDKRTFLFACRPEEGTPACVAVGDLASTRDAAILPGNTVALRGNERNGLYAW